MTNVTGGQLETYLLTHPDTNVLEFLVQDESLWLVRWPSGTVNWQSAASLEARGFAIPKVSILNERSPQSVPDDEDTR